MVRTWQIPFVALVVAATSCGGPTTAPAMTAPPTTSATLHGEVEDPIGDALSDSRVSVSPDLARATVDVAGGNLTLVILFAPGTLDRQSTRVVVLLDIDQDGSTGIRQPDGLGGDYGIDLMASTMQATVTKADPTGCAADGACFNAVASVPIIFVPEGMRATVSLSLLGSDDGRMSFRVNSNVLVAPFTAIGFDLMPDINLPPARVQ